MACLPDWQTFGKCDIGKLFTGENDPYAKDFPDLQGPGGELSLWFNKRWQSRCLQGDALCGEGYRLVLDSGNQTGQALQCGLNPPCKHQKYHEGEDDEWDKDFIYHPATKLTTNGGKFLALKTFPEAFRKGYPDIAHVETFREGVHVYFRLYYTNPLNPQNDPLTKVNGFGFVGVNGSGWARAEFPFSNLPYWARYWPGFNRVDLPFNHLCGEPSAYESDVEAWVIVYNPDGSIRDGSPGLPIHMTCNAPKEVITPFFDH